MSEQTESVVLADGKYTVLLKSGEGKFVFYALRYNEEWRAGTHLDNLHLAMFQEIRNLQEKRRPTADLFYDALTPHQAKWGHFYDCPKCKAVEAISWRNHNYCPMCGAYLKIY